MRLDRLLDDVEVLELRGDPAATDVDGVTYDSRQSGPGALFCCLPGLALDGHDFAADAVRAGATAILCERLVPVDVVQVRVSDARRSMAPIAAAFWGHPSRDLAVVGVTGTNGKTTTVHLLAAVLEADGRRTGVVGTLTGVRTTPEAPDLQAQLAGFRAHGMAAVAMEVSSHALELARVDCTRFAVAVFTNLGQDHLDFHGTVERYFAAKARLFDPARADRAVVNADDRYGRLLLDAARVPTCPFSLEDARDLDVGAGGSTFVWEGQRVRLRIGGVFNVANALAAATTARELGVLPPTVAGGLAEFAPLPGRFEPVDAGQPFTVIVDYAHTPDALERVLGAARSLARRRLTVVFGCGGDRDHAKRPLMGDVASRLADLAVLTSDNPRHEDPLVIIEDVRAGVRRPEALVVEPDRRAAIALAIGQAEAGDVIVIAGKGHETGQTIGNDVVPFDDREVAREELARR